MKTTAKRVSQAIIVCAMLVSVCLVFLCGGVSSVRADEGNEGKTYFRAQLKGNALAEKFYGILEKMHTQGDFRDGEPTYALVANGDFTAGEIDAYTAGTAAALPTALGAARDAFYMDHPEIFYLDPYALYLSAGTGKDGKTVAYIDSGDADNTYVRGSGIRKDNVVAEIAKFDAARDTIVTAARAAGTDPAEQIKAVNHALCEKITYDYGARDDAQSGGTIDDESVYNAYGALVNGKALCGGYARAFKVVMDALDIPCVLVQGNVRWGKASGLQAHMWNAVRIRGHWYGVDVTANDAPGQESKYLLVGDQTLSATHYSDGEISSSGYVLQYPNLRTFGYGIQSDSQGFRYLDEGYFGNLPLGYQVASNGTTTLTIAVSYNGLNATALEESGKHLAFRYGYPDDTWADWYSISRWAAASTGEEAGEYSIVVADTQKPKIEFAVADIAPTNIMGKYDDLPANHILDTSDVYNVAIVEGEKLPPYVTKRVPDEYGMILSFEPMAVSLTYSEELVTKDGAEITDTTPIHLTVHGSTHEDMTAETKVRDIKYDAATRTLSFTFVPAADFAYNCEMYTFVPDLIGKKSGKTPDAGGYYSFKHKQVICPKVFNDGRLYMQVYGKPQFVGAEDMSVSDFADAEGRPIRNQRSQMMLVVNEPSEELRTAMTDELQGKVSEENLAKSSTYEIDLHVCGVVRKVPAGSYMQVGFGFPDGYAFDTKNVTYTVYHYKLDDDGKVIGVEEVPCVITEAGIVAKVTSFSPFLICPTPVGKENAARNIYAYVEGDGGKLDRTTITPVKKGENVSFTLTADSGYAVGELTLDGKDASAYREGNTVTIPYADLALRGSTLRVRFASDRVTALRAERGETIVRPMLVVKDGGAVVTPGGFTYESGEKDNTVGVVLIVISAILIVATGVILAVYFAQRSGKTPAPATAGASKANAAKSAAMVSPKTNTAKDATATNTARPTSTAPRPTNTARPASTAPRPTSTARPASTAPRPTNTARPASTTPRPTSTARPANPAPRPTNTTRPTSTAPRPTNTARPASTAPRPTNTTRPRPTDKK